MIKMFELREIIKYVNQSSIDDFELKDEKIRIAIKKAVHVSNEPKAIESPIPITEMREKQAAVLEKEVPSKMKGEANLVTDASASNTTDESNLHKIVSPMVGIFHFSPKSGGAPYVKVGDKVEVNTILCECHVEPLKIYETVTSDVSGVIVEALCDDGEFVEYGQPLFLIKC
jgi:acetyl-CoA carboxylase biotin carboxyl carrier protein